MTDDAKAADYSEPKGISPENPVDSSEVVGHKTFCDEHGRRWHEPITRAEGDALWAAMEAAKAKRAELYPSAEDAVRGMCDARQRLMELGWQDARYAPPDRKPKRVVEFGSSGIHDAYCERKPAPPNREGEKWWWGESHGDVWPITPVLYLPSDEELAEREARIAAARKALDR